MQSVEISTGVAIPIFAFSCCSIIQNGPLFSPTIHNFFKEYLIQNFKSIKYVKYLKLLIKNYEYLERRAQFVSSLSEFPTALES